MAAEQEIRNMSEDNIFDALMEQYGKAAGESISAMLKTKVEIKAPEKSETLVKDVEYSILEPALFVKSCLTSNAALDKQGWFQNAVFHILNQCF